MKTKFILHGGFNPGAMIEDNTAFYSEILKDAPDNAKVLLVPFAKEEDRIIPATTKISEEFNKVKGNKNIEIEVASETDFLQQLDSADIAYFHGGVSLRLLEALKKYPNLKDHIRGQIFAGESAGANVWAKYFYSPKVDGVFEGLGILPLKICPHYKREYKGKLDRVGDGLEEVLLKEYEHRVFYKD